MCELGGEAKVIQLLEILALSSHYLGAILHVATRTLVFPVLRGKWSRETLIGPPADENTADKPSENRRGKGWGSDSCV